MRTRRSTTQAPAAIVLRGSSHVRLVHLLAAAGLVLAASSTGTYAVRAQDGTITVTDDEGTVLSLPGAPQRIASLSPANTEIVFALGAGDRLVGGTDFDDHPAEAAALPDVVAGMGVVMERLVALEPDLVLAGGNGLTSAVDIGRMRELGMPVLVVYPPTVDAVLADIDLIGAAIGEPDEAVAITAEMREQLDAIAVAMAYAEGSPRTFYQIGSEPEIYAPAPDSFVADLVELAGGEPITTADPALWAISLEELLVADPEVILLGDAVYTGVCPADVLARATWSDMTAVKEGRIYPVDDIVVTRPGPRLPQGLASLVRAIHPEVELTGFPPDPPICADAAA